MAQPQRKSSSNPDIRPDLRAIDGGGESTPDRAKLGAVEDLQNQESEGNVIQGPWGNKPGGDGSSEDVRDAEDKGGWSNKISSSYAGNKARGGQGISKANFKAVLKKRGPLAAIITLVVGGGIGASAFFGPALLLVQLQESVLAKYNSQSTSMTIRSDKLLANKITGNATSGSCQFVKVVCRFSRPSNRLLTQLEKNGVTALDKNGDLIKRTGPFQTDRPVTYVFEGEKVPASKFYGKLRSDAKFRAVFHRSYNPKYVALSDFIFNNVRKRFGFDVTDKKGGDSTKTATEDLNDSSKVASAAAGEAGAEGESLVKKLLSTEARKMIEKITAGTKGDTVGLVAATICAAGDIPSLITSTVRAYQVVQLINYAAPILVIAGKLKSGDITSTEANKFGSLFTKTVNGKSAMDSFGIQHTMFGANKASSTAEATAYKRFSPGANAISTFGGVNKILQGDIKKNVCSVATNPATGVGINAVLAANTFDTLGASLLIAGINITLSFAASAAVDAFVVPLIEKVIAGIDVNSLLLNFLGDLTQNLAGEDVGNAFASGASNLLSQTANAGGNMPLSINDAIAYNKSSQDVKIAYAEEDRATLSPLDPSSPNTMVGSIISGLSPYLSQMSSLTGIFSSIASIPSGSLSALTGLSTAHAASSAEDYSLCEDPQIADDKIAAGPFCNVEYGIPTQYLGMDPRDVVNYLVNSGDVDEKTGEPIDRGDKESLFKWVTTCTDGRNDQLKNCQITGPDADTKAMYSLYTIDHRIQIGMDEESGTTNPATSAFNSDSIDQTVADTGSTAKPEPVQATYFTQFISKPQTSPVIFSSVTTSQASTPTLGISWYWMAT